jgi:hypothetical protein
MIDITLLFVVATQAQLYARALEVASALGLSVTSWRAGDPTRSLYYYLAEVLSTLETIVSEYIKSGFLSTATGKWLTILASELYGVERELATYATPTVTLVNGGGGFYPLEVGDLTVKCSATGKTFHNTDAFTLSAGTTHTFSLIADEAGSDSAVGEDEIDEFVTTLLGVTISGSGEATARDEQSDDSLKDQCRASLGALSPNGPADAYEYVVRNSALTGSSEITRAKTAADSDTGDVTVYVAGVNGAVSGGAITLAQAAVLRWATPLCVTPTVVNGANVEVDFEAEVEAKVGEDLPFGWEAVLAGAVQTYLEEVDFNGSITLSKLDQVAHDALPAAKKITWVEPAADVELALNEVPLPGDFAFSEVV